jgi:hypothetical protein
MLLLAVALAIALPRMFLESNLSKGQRKSITTQMIQIFFPAKPKPQFLKLSNTNKGF